MPNQTVRYHEHVRNDVLKLVPQKTKTVLSIGCGAGKTESLLLQQGCDVTGIELDKAAAKSAEKNGLKVLNCSAEKGLDQLSGSHFDCIILADVLEHLDLPENIIRSCMPLLSESGKIVVSIPNFRHYTVFKHLFINGHAPDMDAGILDKTHIHITTMKKLELWLYNAGCRTDKKVWKLNRRLEKIASILSFKLLDDFLAPQVLVVASIDQPHLE